MKAGPGDVEGRERSRESLPVLRAASRWPLRVYALIVSLIAAAAMVVPAFDCRESAPPPVLRAPEPPRAIVVALEDCEAPPP